MRERETFGKSPEETDTETNWKIYEVLTPAPALPFLTPPPAAPQTQCYCSIFLLFPILIPTVTRSGWLSWVDVSN